MPGLERRKSLRAIRPHKWEEENLSLHNHGSAPPGLPKSTKWQVRGASGTQNPCLACPRVVKGARGWICTCDREYWQHTSVSGKRGADMWFRQCTRNEREVAGSIAILAATQGLETPFLPAWGDKAKNGGLSIRYMGPRHCWMWVGERWLWSLYWEAEKKWQSEATRQIHGHAKTPWAKRQWRVQDVHHVDAEQGPTKATLNPGGLQSSPSGGHALLH